MDYVHGDYKRRREYKYYNEILGGLQNVYNREILLSILSDSPDSLESASKDLISNAVSF